MPLPDNRIRFPAGLIDFDDDVGTTGQSHDGYPAPGQQPRFDWMRMMLIGLLANQSSFTEPTEYREGTTWFDLNNLTLKIRRDNAWVAIANVIELDQDQEGNPITLGDVYLTIKTLLGNKPTATFSGTSNSNNKSLIPIPEPLQSAGGAGSRPLVWINGIMVDPRNSEYLGSTTAPTSIRLVNNIVLDKSDRYTVLMLNIDSSLFHVPDVTV